MADEIKLEEAALRIIKDCDKKLRDFDKVMDNFEKLFLKIDKKLSQYQNSFDQIKSEIEIMEETFRNVLIAIRQNEYLQAYYPAQAGFPEMKVAGSHPVQTLRRKSVKNQST